MVTIEDIQKYEIYLNYLEKKLGEAFEEQSPYIFCKEGCSSCCELGEYPFSEIEFSYLMMGVRSLDPQTINIIEKNIDKIRKDKQECDGKFLYACPFLVNKRCSLYKFRGIICRSHGLAFFSKNKKLLVPACVDEGLNYSNVYDFENRTISSEKYRALGIEQEPLAHNVGVHFLTNNEITQELNLDFGEIKPMCEWFLTSTSD
ncbi:MAG: hypothetical protein NC200_02330 [Candidatus Gastranaerophilales bacterium]|nr:hypothetical protein [Candidatus Gastranaerophilales bacterium]